MKKALAVVLALMCLVSLSGCGNDGKTLSQRIEEWENFSLPGLRQDREWREHLEQPADAVSGVDTGDAVVAGEVVEEMDEDALAAAEAARAADMERAMRSLSGSWAELGDYLPLFRPIVSWYGYLVLEEDGTWRSETTSGTWDLDEGGKELTLRGTRGRTRVEVIRDGSLTKLVVEDLHLCFLRKNEIKDYIQERFVIVKLTDKNVGSYIKAPVCVGEILDEKDKRTGDSAWVIGSAAYEDGLVYYGRSEDFRLVIQELSSAGSRVVTLPYDTISLSTGLNFGKITSASGTLVFVRSEYVRENRMTDARTRTLTFTDGTTHSTSMTWYSDLADYGERCF